MTLFQTILPWLVLTAFLAACCFLLPSRSDSKQKDNKNRKK